jgi:hypothetical protein
METSAIKGEMTLSLLLVFFRSPVLFLIPGLFLDLDQVLVPVSSLARRRTGIFACRRPRLYQPGRFRLSGAFSYLPFSGF